MALRTTLHPASRNTDHDCMERIRVLTDGSDPAPRGFGAPRRGNHSDELDRLAGTSLEGARAQVVEACREMENFHQMEPAEIMRSASRHLARLNTLRIGVMRVEHVSRPWRDLRVREAEPAIEALRLQFTIASRLHAVDESAARTDPVQD